IVAIMAEAGREVARKSVRTASMNLIKLLVTKGDFIGFIADALVAAELASGELLRIPGTGITASPFGLVSVKDDLATQPVRALRDILARSAFAPLQAMGGVASQGA
ncbi:MAG: LysR substrate-binding domain-containing protein, partial [Sphingobium sp.]